MDVSSIGLTNGIASSVGLIDGLTANELAPPVELADSGKVKLYLHVDDFLAERTFINNELGTSIANASMATRHKDHGDRILETDDTIWYTLLGGAGLCLSQLVLRICDFLLAVGQCVQ